MFSKKIKFLAIFAVGCFQLTSCQRTTEGTVENGIYKSEKFAFKTPQLCFNMKCFDKKVDDCQINIIFTNDFDSFVVYEVVMLDSHEDALSKTDPKNFLIQKFHNQVLTQDLEEIPDLKVLSEESIQIEGVGDAFYVSVLAPKKGFTNSQGKTDLTVGYLFSLCDNLLVVMNYRSSMLMAVNDKNSEINPYTELLKSKLIQFRKDFYSIPSNQPKTQQ